MRLFAPAKINLTLEVLGRRPDGYHEIRSVMQTINLCDELRFEPADRLEIKSVTPGWEPEKSLVTKAVRLWQEATGCRKGALIGVVKRIPLVSGLGGDSSGAAAVLRGLDEFCGTRLPEAELNKLAAALGSDVPFFLHGGTALAEGRGEKIARLPPMPPAWVVLVVPDTPRLPGKTAALYGSLTPGDYTDGAFTERFIKALRAGEDPAPYLYNVFERVAYDRFPGLASCRERLSRLGLGQIHLAGSGPALFMMSRDGARAKEWHARLEREGFEAYLVRTTR